MKEHQFMQSLITNLIFLLFILFIGCSDLTSTSDTSKDDKIKESEISITTGTLKNDVIKKLGRPLTWAKVESPGKVNITADYNLSSLKQSMHSNDIWIFEYKKYGGKKYCIFLMNDKVYRIREGSLLMKDE